MSTIDKALSKSHVLQFTVTGQLLTRA